MKDLRKIILKELYKSTYNSAAAKSVEQGDDELALDFLHHSNEMGIPELNGASDIDADGIPDDEDDELSVDRFDIRQRIQSELNTKEIEVGDYGDGKIECDNCDWSWDVKDGGDDLYMCHKCGYDNK